MIASVASVVTDDEIIHKIHGLYNNINSAVRAIVQPALRSSIIAIILQCLMPR